MHRQTTPPTPQTLRTPTDFENTDENTDATAQRTPTRTLTRTDRSENTDANKDENTEDSDSEISLCRSAFLCRSLSFRFSSHSDADADRPIQK